MNTIEITMPEGLEDEVFAGLTTEQKAVIMTQAKCESLMDYIVSSLQRANAPRELADTVAGMAGDLFAMALAYSMHEADVDSDEQARELMERGNKFTESARATALAAVKEANNG